MFDKALVTVWSAPNYCYRYSSTSLDSCGNVAAFMSVSESPDPTFQIFNTMSDLSKIQNYRNVVPYFL
jgi:serine/threonine-protein phosphatase 4 catalytic subunit